MAKCTKEQYQRWNAKAQNGFRFDLQHFLMWGEKRAERSIMLPNGNRLSACLEWHDVLEDEGYYRKSIGVKPRLSLMVWSPAQTAGIWRSEGFGAIIEVTDKVYKKKSWDELAKYTSNLNDDILMTEMQKNAEKLGGGRIAG